jgi:hypothetical protein
VAAPLLHQFKLRALRLKRIHVVSVLKPARNRFVGAFDDRHADVLTVCLQLRSQVRMNVDIRLLHVFPMARLFHASREPRKVTFVYTILYHQTSDSFQSV